MNNLSGFQIGVIAVFVVLALLGVVVFATGFGIGRNDPLPEVVVWGTVNEDVMKVVLSGLKRDTERFDRVSYVEKDPRTYNEEFVNALASGRGPDLFLLREKDIIAQNDKVLTIPFKKYSERMFRNNFIEEGELFLRKEGIMALPFSVDPMVMYWNRDIFSNEGIANPPSFWDEFFILSPRITKRDRSSSIVQSFVAFGEYRNVVHAKDILSALILQTGNPIVTFSERGGLVSTFEEKLNYLEPPVLAALRFYTEFSNPVKSVYSWNRALPDSRQSFIAGDLAIYIGFASELPELQKANPNLNFDVAKLPRSRESNRSVTFGRLSALAIPLGSRNTDAAFEVAQALSSASQVSIFAQESGLPPVRRDLLSQKPTDSIL